MNRNIIFQSLATLALAGSLNAFGGTYKHISIDGSFDDWAGLAPVFTRSSPDTTTSVAYKDIYVANDENYLYIRFTLFAADNPFTANQNIFVDADNDVGTGFGAGGARVGSEMLIQGQIGYQEKNGGFNEGGISGLDWAAAPGAPAADFEMRISRRASYSTDGAPVFSNDTIAFLLEAENSAFVPVEFAPDTGGVVYTFENPPAVLTTNLTLIDLANSSWQVNGSGTDLGSAWLDSAYDDTSWNNGPGLFGFTTASASYPTIHTSLTSGPNTYYFRNHFSWNYQSSNIVFVVTNYLSDGAVYYLNGAELRRVRMPSGPIAYSTPATGAAAPVGKVEVFSLSGSALVVGQNILEVETHQASGSASDMVFGLSFTAAAQLPIVLVDTTEPLDRTVEAGQSTTFSAEIIGTAPIVYQWLKDGTAIAGATNASLTIPLVLAGDAGAYSVRASNAFATNTTRGAVLTVTLGPVVITDVNLPGNVSLVEGSPASFAVAVSGAAPLQYQWFKGNNAIADATNAVYTIPSVLPPDAGNYYVRVSNPINATNSRTAVLTVLADTVPPKISQAQGSPNRVTLTFSEPLDPTTASAAGNYSLSGGVAVLASAVDAANPSQVNLTTGVQKLGTLYTVTVSGVQDRFGNAIAANAQTTFLSTVVIDGSFDDWQSLTPLYSGAQNSPEATDFKDIYAFNDSDYLYFRLTTWESTVFPGFYNNMFLDTDNDPTTGYVSWGGAEILLQGGLGYQEKNGTFNEGPVNGLDWLCSPAVAGTNFEFRISRAATYDSDHTLVFGTNVINFIFDGENSSYASVNRAPDSGSITYNLVESASPPPGPLTIQQSGGQVIVSWPGTGTLQASDSLSGGTWVGVPNASSPFTVPPGGKQRYFRLTR